MTAATRLAWAPAPAAPRVWDPAQPAYRFAFDLFVGSVVLGHFAYVLAFNHMPDSLRFLAAGVLLLMQIALAAAALVWRPQSWSVLVASGLAVKIACWLLVYWFGAAPVYGSSDVVREMTRQVLPFVAGIWLLSYADRIPIPALSIATLVATALGMIMAIREPPYMMPDDSIFSPARLAAFTGGEEGLHSSAYFFLLMLFLLFGLRSLRQMPKGALLIFVPLLLAVLVKYQVRTVLIMLVTYFVGRAWYSRWRRCALELVLLFAGMAFIGAALVFLNTNALAHADDWGSGRIGSYVFRFQLLMGRDLFTLFFGSGPGSDAFVTPEWWWAPLDSHSDLISAMVQTGWFGLFADLLLFAGLFKRCFAARPLLLSLLACSLLSNGLLARPVECFFLLLAAAVVEAPPLRLEAASLKAVPA